MNIDIKVRIMSGPFVGMGGTLTVDVDKSIPFHKQLVKINDAIVHYGEWVKTRRDQISPNREELLKILFNLDHKPSETDVQLSLF